MPPEAAQIVFAVIFSIGTLIWALSLRMASRLGKSTASQENPWATTASAGWVSDETKRENPWAAGAYHGGSESQQIAGQQTVPGNAEYVSAAIAEKMMQTSVPGAFSGLFEVSEQNRERVSVRKTGSLVCNQPSGLYFSEADFVLSDNGQGAVDVAYTIGFDRLGRGLRTISLAVILGLGLPVLVVLAAVLWIFVVNSANPSIRWQVLQSLQVVHVLWPPFLLMWMYRAGKRHSRTHVSNMLRSIRPAQIAAKAAVVEGR